ncbi:uncharacterized protein IWZ02DRAFT_103080 [Phyllosticta citriasiana]|uniref:uncharacterized protein n=1 Tax=Phyllosticta citriasiana TaxID=595635 RepID=UPI0030FD3B5A
MPRLAHPPRPQAPAQSLPSTTFHASTAWLACLLLPPGWRIDLPKTLNHAIWTLRMHALRMARRGVAWHGRHNVAAWGEMDGSVTSGLRYLSLLLSLLFWRRAPFSYPIPQSLKHVVVSSTATRKRGILPSPAGTDKTTFEDCGRRWGIKLVDC